MVGPLLPCCLFVVGGNSLLRARLLLQKHYKPWALVAAALFVIYFPVVELPGDLARQYIGRWLTGPIDNTFYEKYRGLYYTKIRPNQVWVLTCPSDYQSVKSLYGQVVEFTN